MSETPPLETVVQRLREFVVEREWGKFHNVKNLSMLLASECGEVLELLRWLDGPEADAQAAGPLAEQLAAELGDVGIAWLLLCDRAGLDPVLCVSRKLERNGVNYPASLSRGRAERPDGPADSSQR